MPLFLVDTIVQKRHRYIIEAKNLNDAYDEITMRHSGNPRDDFLPLSEMDLGETIIDGRQITNDDLEQEFLRLKADSGLYEEIDRIGQGTTIVRKINYEI